MLSLKAQLNLGSCMSETVNVKPAAASRIYVCLLKKNSIGLINSECVCRELMLANMNL